MFTGIITHLGKVIKKTDSDLQIQADSELIEKLSDGMSVAINGICLTVVAYDAESFSIDFMPETSKRTTINNMHANDLVNLELSATPTTFLAGHIVQGHVDAVGEITAIEQEENSRIFTIQFTDAIGKYIVEKGSIAVNGISLTVISITKHNFTVGIIPHTWERTMLHTTSVGDSVNLEVDVIAKYLEKLTQK